jgi:ACS family D-galactonate transporter-like MFS transporter
VTAPSPAIEVRASPPLWRIVTLLVLSVSINYIDRGNLSIAAPLLKDEMGISPSQLGILLSSFFWTYAAFQIISGWLVDRFNVKWVMAAGFFFWSLATAATGQVKGFALLLVLRMALGIGESVAYPCYSKILASHFAEHQRGLANALIDAGTKCGPALGTLLGGVLIAHFGWRPFFIVLGLGSMLWLPPWFRWMPQGHHLAARVSRQVPSMAEILSKRAAWATFAGHFCANYFWYFLLTWLPFYLVREQHFSLKLMATIASLAYFVTAAASAATGWISDHLIAAGATPTRVRKTCTGAGLGFATVVLAVTLVPDPTLSIVLLMTACVSYGVYASSHWAITQTIAGPDAAGKWTGMQNFVANLAGVAAPVITGFVVDRNSQFFWAFAVTAAVVLAGASIYVFALGPVEPVKWCRRSA